MIQFFFIFSIVFNFFSTLNPSLTENNYMGYENNYIWYGILSEDQLNTEEDRGQILIVCSDLRGMAVGLDGVLWD